MNTFVHLSIWLMISIGLSVVVHADATSNSQLQRKASKDSLRIQTESTNTDTFKLLPKFDEKQDTTGSKLIPRPKYVPKKDNTFKLLPKFDPEQDTAGFQLIPRHQEDADFVPYDKEPQIIKKVDPIYPEGAKREGLEGKVIVKMLIDAEGKVKQVVVLKSDAEIFNEPAIEAAKQFLFTPAYLNNKPVAVWVSFPFQFELIDKNK